jgi:hypothetical protein
MTPKQRGQRAREILDDEVVRAALAEMEKRAIDDFVIAANWWWGDRRRRIAAERIREVRDFRTRLEMTILAGPQERTRSIA